ncbi:hypothetical protein HC62_14585 [Acetobacter tropicalis]|uniref:Uncharacterized protein n=1 Tax=Acetobacter tropicalis TaxID=104102 RepID=A0A252A3Q0_9PROT|nr:hypothetical protein HC62_14585 [Acetobacter tropicalis]
MTFSDFCKATRPGLIHPAKARTVYSMVCQEVYKSKITIETQLDLQDLIYNRTHDLKMSGYAEKIWNKYIETQVLYAWNDNTCIE